MYKYSKLELNVETSQRIRPLSRSSIQPLRLPKLVRRMDRSPNRDTVASAAQAKTAGSIDITNVLSRAAVHSDPSSASELKVEMRTFRPATTLSSKDETGLEAWKHNREAWKIKCKDCTENCRRQHYVLNPYASYEDIVGPDGMLEQPIPLSELIEVLVDEWIDDGLYG